MKLSLLDAGITASLAVADTLNALLFRNVDMHKSDNKLMTLQMYTFSFT